MKLALNRSLLLSSSLIVATLSAQTTLLDFDFDNGGVAFDASSGPFTATSIFDAGLNAFGSGAAAGLTLGPGLTFDENFELGSAGSGKYGFETASDAAWTNGINLNNYITFTLETTAGNVMSLDALELQISQGKGGAAHRPDRLELRSGIDGFTSSLGVLTLNTGADHFTATSFDLTGGAFDSITAVEFRLYAYRNTDGTSGGREIGFIDAAGDYLRVTGDISVIPEPAVVGFLAGLTALGFVGYRRARKS